MPNHPRAARTSFDLGRSGVGEGAGSRGPGECETDAHLNKRGPEGPWLKNQGPTGPGGREANAHLNEPTLSGGPKRQGRGRVVGDTPSGAEEEPGRAAPDAARGGGNDRENRDVSFCVQNDLAPYSDGGAAPRLALDRPPRRTEREVMAEVRRVAALVDGPVFRVGFLERHSDLRHRTLCRRFGSWREVLLRAGLGHLAAPERSALYRARLRRRYGDDELLERLRAAARAKGSDTIRSGDIPRYTGLPAWLYGQRFGSWAAAVERAGLKPHWLRAVYGEDACFDNLRRVWMHLRRPPGVEDMRRPPSTIREDIYRRRWGGWRRTLEAFVARINAAPDDPLLGAVRAWQALIRTRHSANGSARPPVPPRLRRNAPPALRLAVFQRDCFRCVLCGDSPARDPACRLEVDHITPFSRGGRTEQANLRTLCHACNAGRGAASDEGCSAAHDEDRGAGEAG